MPARIWIPFVVVCVIAGACGGPDPARRAGPEPTPSFDTATALIRTDDGPVLLTVEVAEKPEQRALGLMHRRSLGDDEGMVFLFFEEQHGGFWMKNTLIPLSIAFFDIDGTIVKILDMEPCKRDPCEVYEPGTGYFGALEVNQGAFERWGVAEGDRVTISR